MWSTPAFEHRVYKRGFHPSRNVRNVRYLRNVSNVRNARNTTDGTDATTDEASDRPFHTPSVIINTNLFFFNIALIVIYFHSCTLFIADD